jgi:hypothetical protein
MRWVVVMVMGIAPLALSQPKEPQRPEALKAFEPLQGLWEGKVTSLPAEWNKKEQWGNVTEEYIWAMSDSSFLHGRTYGESGSMMAMSMWGYDAKNKLHRMWFFGVGGIVTMWEGTWNAQTQTLTLKTELTPEIISTATIKYIDADNREQTVITRGSDGKTYQHVVAKMQRRK